MFHPSVPAGNALVYPSPSSETLAHAVRRRSGVFFGIPTAIVVVLALGTVRPASGRATAHAAGAQLPSQAVVRLHSVGTLRVSGRAMLSAVHGGTKVVLNVRGLPSGARAAAFIHYGSCSDLGHLSASSASLPGLRADARGRARATGRVRTALLGQNVRLSVLVDGHHVVVIVLGAKGLVACGRIP